jgi:putative transposase
MNERLKFVGRLLQGEKMAELCREFGISRKTGYKFWDRYQKVGFYGLGDRPRRPYRYANQLPVQLEQEILRIKREKPSWGAPKIREILARRYPTIHSPAKSTIHCILDRHGLVTRHKKRRFKAQGTALVSTQTPNDLWCADFKGEFMLADRRYCYP